MPDALLPHQELTDTELAHVSLQGDPGAFGELIQRHWKHCVEVACYFLHDRGEAEDQVQNAALKAYQHLEQYQGDAEFATWLARIVTNECLMLLRVRQRACLVYLDEPATDQQTPLQLASLDADPEGQTAFAQMTQLLRFELGRIPRLLRNVMLLRDIRGLPMQDVADQLGITVSAAKSRLVRARAELRSRMTRHYSGLREVSPLSRNAAPLNRVGRHRAIRMAS